MGSCRLSLASFLRRTGVVLLFCGPLLGDLNASTAYIYLDSTRQVIRGFGAANILPWRPDMTQADIQAAFGTDEGQIGLSILRLRVPSDPAQFALNYRTARAAYAMGVKLIATPWSPPPSLKTNGSIVGGRLKPECYADYARHLRAFADSMARNGAPLYAISIQNEPDIQVTYESCDWSPEEMVRFLREHGRSIGVRIIAPESYHFDKTYSDAILNDSLAAQNVDIIGGHIYGGGLEPYPLAEKLGKEIWMTEHLDLDTTWTGVLRTAKEISDCMNAGMSAYIWWYIVRYYGPILEGGTGRVSKRGHVMAQFARFVRPGFVRLATTYIPQRWVYVTAYTDSADRNRLVIIAINECPYAREQTFVLVGSTVEGFASFRTSQTESCSRGPDFRVVDGSFSVTLPPASITTFVSRATSEVADDRDAAPRFLELGQNHPNPFNSTSRLVYYVHREGLVSLKLYDLRGQEVLTLDQGHKQSGRHEVIIDSTGLPSGIYVCRLTMGSFSACRKVAVVK
ncbi:MAG: T9SS type A sorting domain-containing protein [candidate division KSB1 bacterium]|nr:T9SS type A sorting domain-containing protein [candidate division KSB1 bacterium]